MRFHPIYSLALLLFSLNCFCQSIKIETTECKNPTNGDKYIFPKVVVVGQTATSQRINNVMREDILDAPKNTKDANIFDNVWATKDRSFARINDISFETVELNEKFICLSISAEGCGAYCEGFTRYFVFNSKTGNQIKLDSIFNKEGLSFLLKRINENKTIIVNDKLKEIEDTLKVTKRDVKESYADMKNMYSTCLDMKADLSYIPNMQFYIKSGTLTVISERCSAHANLALDELMEFKYEVVLKEEEHLTKFGMAITK